MRFLGFLVGVAMLAPPAWATVTANYSLASGVNVTMTHPTGQTTSTNLLTKTGKWTFTQADTSGGYAGLGKIYNAFCVDLNQSVDNNVTYTVVPPSQVPQPSTYYNQPMGTLKAGLLAELLNRNWDSLTTALDWQAMQLAVWEVVYEDYTSQTFLAGVTLNVNGSQTTSRGRTYASGSAQALPGIVTKANGYLNTITGTSAYPHKYSLIGLQAPIDKKGNPNYYQDFVTVVAPVPGAAFLVGLGVGVIGWLRRKRMT